MAKYGEFYYNSGQTYGVAAPNAFSVEPFTAEAIWYNQILVTWQEAKSGAGESFSEWRIVRNQFAYPDTPDDGVTLAGGTVSSATNLVGGSKTDTSLLSVGKFVFYRFWIRRTSDNTWIVAGEAQTILPREHSSRLSPSYIGDDGAINNINTVVETTHDKLMGFLPKIFTTGEKLTDSYDPESVLSKFLQGFSFTLDEFLTYTQLIVPGTSGIYTNEPILKLQSHQLGLSLDPEGLTRSQKKLVRNAVYLYSRKGTAVGIKGFAESVTGYPTTVTTTSNLLLSLQDATFYKNVGNWKTANSATITAVNTVAPAASVAGDLILDSTWTATVVNTVSQYGTIRLGMEDPVRTGIPVVAGTTYYLNFYIKSASASPGVFSMDINWFNEKGIQIADAHSNTGGAVTSSWTELSYNRAAPTGSKFAAISITFSNTAAEYSVDRVQFYATNITTYSEPRAAYVSLSPTKYNYLKNPTFVSGGEAWVYNNSTQTTPTSTLSVVSSGSTMLQLDSTANSSSSSPYLTLATTTGLVDVGNSYTFSTFAKSGTSQALSMEFSAVDTGVNNLITNSNFEVSSSTGVTRTNLITNPSFETNTTSWGTIGTTVSPSASSAQAFSGTKSYLVTANGTGLVGAFNSGIAFAFTPVTVGTTYTSSIYVRDIDTAVSYYAGIEWRNSGGSSFSTANGTTTAVTSSGWTRISVTAIAPLNAVTAGLVFYSSTTPANGKQVYFDGALFEIGSSVNPYFDGSTTPAGDFTYAWTGTANASTSAQVVNLVDGWSNVYNPGGLAYGLYRTSEFSRSGSKSMALVMRQGTGASVFNIGTPILSTIKANKTYTSSVYVYASRTQNVNLVFTVTTAGGSTYPGTVVSVTAGTWTRVSYTYTMPYDLVSSTIQIQLTPTSGDYIYFDQFLLEESSTLNPVKSSTSTTNIALTSTWARYQGTVFIPTSYNKATTTLYLKVYGSSGSGVTFNFDCAQIEVGATATDYFDGSLTSLGAGWTGTTNNSTSYIYQNRTAKISRLNSEIKDFIPINTGYFVNTLLALEKSGITT